MRESRSGRFPGPHLPLARETDEGGNTLRCADFRYANRTYCMRLSGQFRDSREADSFEMPARVHRETDRVRICAERLVSGRSRKNGNGIEHDRRRPAKRHLRRMFRTGGVFHPAHLERDNRRCRSLFLDRRYQVQRILSVVPAIGVLNPSPSLRTRAPPIEYSALSLAIRETLSGSLRRTKIPISLIKNIVAGVYSRKKFPGGFYR
jgi:hypothetical protein